ncbi:hypothetical protein DPMN_128808 [Dreissena polymorpha]|uniref:Uncharacterized protein n=1 Tax=Dreissena polymorpha TaxID=45954 RepID=A0A9D4JWS8_DREPO|nr:hypothetical protein DPMN_128808 [Dreissena polymorpha]
MSQRQPIISAHKYLTKATKALEASSALRSGGCGIQEKAIRDWYCSLSIHLPSTINIDSIK